MDNIWNSVVCIYNNMMDSLSLDDFFYVDKPIYVYEDTDSYTAISEAFVIPIKITKSELEKSESEFQRFIDSIVMHETFMEKYNFFERFKPYFNREFGCKQNSEFERKFVEQYRAEFQDLIFKFEALAISTSNVLAFGFGDYSYEDYLDGRMFEIKENRVWSGDVSISLEKALMDMDSFKRKFCNEEKNYFKGKRIKELKSEMKRIKQELKELE